MTALLRAWKRPDWYKADMKPDEMRACLVKNLHVDADLATTLAQRYQNDTVLAP